MTRRLEAAVTYAGDAEIGECPLWDARSGELLWVDIARGIVHRLRLADHAHDEAQIGQPVGAIVTRRAGGYALAVRDGFATWPSFGSPIEIVAPVEAELTSNRMNDGKCDPQNRFWAGTMAADAAANAGALYVLEPDGRVSRVLDGLTISNGLGWDVERGRMYFVDSALRRIDVFDYDGADGAISERRPLVEFSEADGLPDGLAVDAEGCVWIAMWGGWCVCRVTPDGELAERIALPVANVSSCAFGGADEDVLYVTSATSGLDAEARAAQPLAGSVFELDVGVRGAPTYAYAG